MQTKHGVLILNYSKEYMTSEASRLELTNIPDERLNLMLPRTPDSGESRCRIVPWTMVAPHCGKGFFRNRANDGFLSALAQRDLRGAERLLRKGADPNLKFCWSEVECDECYWNGFAVDKESATCPLHCAAKAGLPDFTELLISARADVNWRDVVDDSALTTAFSQWKKDPDGH